MTTKSGSNPPPSYDSISTSSTSTDFKHLSVLSFLKHIRAQRVVRTRIRDLVSAPDFTPSSVPKIVNACAADITTAQFSNLLQTPDIEGHTALYWAIVNDRREAFSAFAEIITEYSSECSSDLRLACMATSDHALFSQLNLGNIDAKDEHLKRFLRCPPDEIEVHEGVTSKLGEHQFIASLRIKMFQKRLRETQNLNFEFIAGGRIWCLHFYIAKSRWCIAIRLSLPSLPACPKTVVLIEAHRGKAKPLRMECSKFVETIVPYGNPFERNVIGTPLVGFQWWLGDWVMYKNPIHVDCDGTLHAKLNITTKN